MFKLLVPFRHNLIFVALFGITLWLILLIWMPVEAQSPTTTTNPSATPIPPDPSITAPLVPTWQPVTYQDFEGIFPYNGWTVRDLSNDGYERFWDDNNYRFYPEPNDPYGWSAWPARGGADGRDPATQDQYFDNMDTRMIYGPFNMSNATGAYASFYLWQDTEACCDYLAFEVSTDGSNFAEVQRWTGTATSWTKQSLYFSSYAAGKSQVWVAWRFYSDRSVTKAGPWVDNISIQKLIPPPTPTPTPTPTITRTPAITPAARRSGQQA